MDMRPFDVTRTTLGVACLVGLVGSSFTVLQPFVPSIIWAVTLVVATWPALRLLQRVMFGSRLVAVSLMTLLLVAIVVAPFGVAVSTIVNHSDEIVQMANDFTTMDLPMAPPWVGDIPMVGDWLTETWNHLASQDLVGLLADARPYVGRATSTFVGLAGSAGQIFVQMLLTILVSAIMFAQGEAAADAALRFGHRIAGERGQNSVILAGQAIRGVALGVVGTALIQTLIGGIGLWVTGVPLAGILVALTLICCIVQLGPGPVVIPATIWLFYVGNTTHGIVMAVFTAVVLLADNVVRPLLIRAGAKLPLLLILAGVLGGLLAFGLIGLFAGPAMLAVTYTLLMAWLRDDTLEAALPPPMPGAPPLATPPRAMRPLEPMPQAQDSIGA